MLEGLLEITPLKFDNYGYYLFMKDTIVHVLLMLHLATEGKLPVISLNCRYTPNSNSYFRHLHIP